MFPSNHLDFEDAFLILDDAFSVEWGLCHENVRALLLNLFACLRVYVNSADVAFLIKAVDFATIANDFDKREGAINLERFIILIDMMPPCDADFLLTLWLGYKEHVITAATKPCEREAIAWFRIITHVGDCGRSFYFCDSESCNTVPIYVHECITISRKLDLAVVQSRHLLSLVLDELGGILLIRWTVQQLKFRLEILRKEVSALCTARCILYKFVIWKV